LKRLNEGLKNGGQSANMGVKGALLPCGGVGATPPQIELTKRAEKKRTKNGEKNGWD
jgi:hypothetical protein